MYIRYINIITEHHPQWDMKYLSCVIHYYIIKIILHIKFTYCAKFLGGRGCVLTWGGEAGEDGAVLVPEEVLLEDKFGVDELPELTVGVESPESGVAAVGCGVWVMWCWTILVWSVGIKGVLSSNVGVGGATREGPGWALN